MPVQNSATAVSDSCGFGQRPSTGGTVADLNRTEAKQPDLPEPFPGHDGGTWEPAVCATVASWPVGSFAENLAVSDAGHVLLSLHSNKRVDRYDPGAGSLTRYVEFPAPVSGLCFDDAGILWVTGGTVGEAHGYVWRVLPDGRLENWVEIPDAVFMNGCTPHVGGAAMLVCESVTGRILAVDLRSKAWNVWLEDSRLRPSTPQMPGANGIKLRGGNAYISVKDRDQILRARVRRDGSCGELEPFLANLRADDFAFGASGALYIATHPANTVMRVSGVGARATIAGAHEGVVGSTACAFGRGARDAASLYVTTSGGLFSPYQGALQEAKLVRIDVGETGGSLIDRP
jgi:hypothetical protein